MGWEQRKEKRGLGWVRMMGWEEEVLRGLGFVGYSREGVWVWVAMLQGL
jgi:hypothetical protein